VNDTEGLSMTSGFIRTSAGGLCAAVDDEVDNPQQILDVWAKKEAAEFEPGDAVGSTRLEHVIAGRIAEIVGGKPLMSMQERIFKPWKMRWFGSTPICEPAAGE